MKWFSCCYQDIEQGFGGKKSKEEAIDILTKAYKSSDNFQQVQTQVSEIYKQVSNCTVNECFKFLEEIELIVYVTQYIEVPF